MKTLVTTKFIAKVPIQVPTVVGGGWSASIQMQTKAQVGEIIICETNQTTASIEEDSSIRIQFPDERISVGFEILGRLVASGAIEQIKE